MRFFAPLFALCAAAVVFAQQNAINIQGSTLNITAGMPTTITWSNPSSGTVTIKLQQFTQQITPQTGIILSSTVQASAQTFTFTIPASSVNSYQYVLEIIDNSNSNNYNFSPPFGIKGATGTAIATATGGSTMSNYTMSQTASTTGSSATGSSASMTASMTGSSSMTASATASKTSGATSSSAAPNSNSGVSMTVHGGLLAIVAGFMAVL